MKRINIYGMSIRINITKTIAKILIIVLIAVSINFFQDYNYKRTYNLSAEQYDFIDTLIQSNKMLEKTATLEDYNERYAVLTISKKDGTKVRQLFDIINKRVISPDFKGRLKSNDKVVFAKNNNYYEYDELGNLISINHNKNSYYINRNENGEVLSTFINHNIIYKKDYKDNKLSMITYGNGDVYTYLYNQDDLCSEIKLNGQKIAEYKYDDNKNLISYTDLKNNTTFIYNYDNDNKLIYASTEDGYKVYYQYNEEGNISQRTYNYNGIIIASKTVDEGVETNHFDVSYEYDFSNRIKKHVLMTKNYELITKYNYVIESPIPQNLNEDNFEELYDNRIRDLKISSIITPYYEFKYNYDLNGNVINYSYGQNNYYYSYDSNEQLIAYSYNGLEHNLIYDDNGNILTKDGNQYLYEKGTDKLIAVNNSEIIYDEIGNPINYLGHAIKWEGRNLTQFDNVVYTYNQSGIRTSKTVQGKTTKYFLEGNKVIFESDGENTITYYYEKNNVIGFNLNGLDYFYIKNARQDIIGIIDSNGELVVEYAYDPFGKILNISGKLSDTIGKLNPYRYASYRYDNETGFYYLNSRYYDPNIGRFLNADDIVNLQYALLGNDISKNLYAYCLNNPVNKTDPNGNMAVKLLNALKFVYAELSIDLDSIIGSVVLILNGGGIFTAFHETAQLVAAKRLNKMGYKTTLEYKVSGVGEADIYATKGSNKYIYEVKHYNNENSKKNALNQLVKYLAPTGTAAGPKFSDYYIDFLPSIQMKVYTPIAGYVAYEFYKEIKINIFGLRYISQSYVSEEKLKKHIEIAFWVGVAVAGTILIATLVEDIVTAGAGVANDVASLKASAYSFRTVLAGAMLLV